MKTTAPSAPSWMWKANHSSVMPRGKIDGGGGEGKNPGSPEPISCEGKLSVPSASPVPSPATGIEARAASAGSDEKKKHAIMACNASESGKT